MRTALWHEVDTTATPITVTTRSADNRVLAVTRWPDKASALAYAERITAMLGDAFTVRGAA